MTDPAHPSDAQPAGRAPRPGDALRLDVLFDSPPGRQGTSSLKWDRYRGRDVIPLWVADMDFESPPAVVEALCRRTEHGVFGYTHASDELEATVVAALERDYSWEVPTDWLVWLPGLVSGLNVVCRAVGKPGDDILTFVPIYPPFLTAPVLAGRTAVRVPLAYSESGDTAATAAAPTPGAATPAVATSTAAAEPRAASLGGRWEMDLDLLEHSLTPRSRLLLLCSPHNPVGRVWSRSELEALAEIVLRHKLIVASDEVHSGLVLDEDRSHLPLAGLGPEIAARIITLMAPSKTYNVPGLGCSFAVISDRKLRRDVLRAMDGIVPHVNLFGYVATQAAYESGGPWLDRLLVYLRANRDEVEREIGSMPGLKMAHVEATYLAWIDARGSRMTDPAAEFEKAGVGLSDGADFGSPGFVRLNFGCSRKVLTEGLRRMRSALETVAPDW